MSKLNYIQLILTKAFALVAIACFVRAEQFYVFKIISMKKKTIPQLWQALITALHEMKRDDSVRNIYVCVVSCSRLVTLHWKNIRCVFYI